MKNLYSLVLFPQRFLVQNLLKLRIYPCKIPTLSTEIFTLLNNPQENRGRMYQKACSLNRGLGAVYMSRASPFNIYNFLLKIILLYMQTGLASLVGISLDSNGAPELAFKLYLT